MGGRKYNRGTQIGVSMWPVDPPNPANSPVSDPPQPDPTTLAVGRGFRFL